MSQNSVDYKANYCLLLAVRGAVNSIGKSEIDVKTIKEAKNMFDEIIEKTPNAGYQTGVKIIEKMLLPGADLKALVIETASLL